MENKTIVDSTGQPVELWVIERDGVLIGCTLSEGCTAVDYLNDVCITTNSFVHPPLRPRWDFDANAWADDATAEELAAAYPALTIEPSAEERIAALEDMMLEQLLGGV